MTSGDLAMPFCRAYVSQIPFVADVMEVEMTSVVEFAALLTAILRTKSATEAVGETDATTALEYVGQLIEKARLSTVPILILTKAIEGRGQLLQRLDLLASF